MLEGAQFFFPALMLAKPSQLHVFPGNFATELESKQNKNEKKKARGKTLGRESSPGIFHRVKDLKKSKKNKSTLCDATLQFVCACALECVWSKQPNEFAVVLLDA